MKGSQIKNKEYWKQRIKSQINRRNIKKEIFGDHYNLSSVKINNNKKYFNEEVKIMEIQRTNRLLLQKIKRISERSKPRNIINRARTEVVEGELELQRSSTQQKMNTKKDLVMKRYRYQSVQSMLEKSRNKIDEIVIERRNQTEQKKQNKQNTNDQKQKVLIFKGNKKISDVNFSFRIYIRKSQYIIHAKTKISEQKIEIPQENYNTLLKEQLEENHKNIFKFMKIGENNKLQFDFKDSKKIQVDIIQKTQIQLPFIRHKQSLVQISEAKK